ncbi:1-(5-phosphoribosyl)-5-[(5-phosphoribosylamino)methylideneamino]imidazole-4-carboxamide isomerase [Robertkochia aurantiaca]|uniref:1-(5-phosphoribosyl)-5-[(5- phosphoribosylamino)methylideneamino]imidazole-4- carboxamide isomerase n=1 Tax=Robertkochia aurantiaca TaxID=2873700 RepID=UPI001CCB8FD7|nr:1-(5-phosphoribosyl)-5-[(5-phosphoribosylamino)methylideneamino]imidazole-4-carboxamide isomerase [Robertkochia sp. 3YJGBD-33]
MRIIPAIDLIDGKCVRLEKGDYDKKKVYNEDPLEVARSFEDHGIEYLHLVDLDGARSQQIVNYRILEKIATKTALKIDFGGGLKKSEDLRIAFESGASQVTGGSIAVKDKEVFTGWLDRYGADKIILGADARDGKIAVSGWQEATDLELFDFVQSYYEEGIRYVICTDISKDGMLGGPAFDLYAELLQRTGNEEKEDLKLVASGGISDISELPKLAAIGCEGTIVGKALYEGRIGLKELESYILGNRPE